MYFPRIYQKICSEKINDRQTNPNRFTDKGFMFDNYV